MYIEGKAKFVNRYEVAFCFLFFLGKTLTKKKNQKFENGMYFERVSIATNEPKDFLIFGQILLLEPYPLYDLKSLMLLLLLLLLPPPCHERDMDWSKKVLGLLLVCCCKWFFIQKATHPTKMIEVWNI
jgi:hypothetical protein